MQESVLMELNSYSLQLYLNETPALVFTNYFSEQLFVERLLTVIPVDTNLIKVLSRGEYGESFTDFVQSKQQVSERRRLMQL